MKYKQKNNRIFCPFCGKDMRLDSRDSDRGFRESANKYFNTRVGILKYSGLFQVLIRLHRLCLVLLVFSGFKKQWCNRIYTSWLFNINVLNTISIGLIMYFSIFWLSLHNFIFYFCIYFILLNPLVSL